MELCRGILEEGKEKAEKRTTHYNVINSFHARVAYKKHMRSDACEIAQPSVGNNKSLPTLALSR